MRRFYAAGGDDPQPDNRETSPQAARSLDAAAWSDRLLPTWLCYRAVSVDIEVPGHVPTGSDVPIVVTMHNALPVPVTVPTDSLRPWTWYVDGVPEASHVDTVPSEPAALSFDRGERKRFRRRWNRLFRVSDDRWESAPAGEYTVGAGLSVADADDHGLYTETTVTLET
jgi:hypothetical protein